MADGGRSSRGRGSSSGKDDRGEGCGSRVRRWLRAVGASADVVGVRLRLAEEDGAVAEAALANGKSRGHGAAVEAALAGGEEQGRWGSSTSGASRR
ncbi:hypothetical protein GW17_00035104 [Ensete ventricosum]|nr:hypothetical protein GW17_00035104 [Ensete ventricosum]